MQQHPPQESRPDASTEALVELSRSVGTMPWDAAIRRIVEFDAHALNVERVSYWDLSEDNASIYCEAGYVTSVGSFEHGARLVEQELPEYFRAMREERVIDMEDVRSDPRCRGLRGYCAARGIASMLDVPVWSEGRLCGVLCHEHVGSPRHWTTREMETAVGMSHLVCTARTSRAHSQATAVARRSAFLDGISRALFSLDAHVVAHRAVSCCVPRVADVAVLWCKDDEGALKCLALDQVSDLGNEVAERVHQREADGPVMATLVVKQGQSLLIPDVTTQVLERYEFAPPDRAAVERMGLSTAMCVPLTIASKVIGALTLLARKRRFGTEDLELAEAIASRIACALENARLYEVSREAIRARDELLAVAAHELRTPLTALLLESDHMLRMAQQRQDAAETARGEKIVGHARRFGALVDHVLDALRIRSEGMTVTRAPCDIAAVLRRRTNSAMPRANAAGSKVSLDCPPSLTGSFDRTYVEKLIDALLDNAIKFGCGRPIAVCLRREGTWAVFTVRDHGMGIPADRQNSIFAPFERACPTAHFGGLGLGLYIARAIVDAHGGSIAVSSAPGQGSTFTVRLPL